MTPRTTLTDLPIRTRSKRRYVVVDSRDASIVYRTDDRAKAIRRATSMDPRLMRIRPSDVLDTTTDTLIHKAR